MRMHRLLLPLVAALLAGGTPARADDLLPADRPIEEVVDHYVEDALKLEGVSPAPPADDATLVRRLTLDLVGRIPTVAEARAYVETGSPAKRAALVDRLMAAPGHVRHQATEFDAMLMGGERGTVREYLLRAFAENRPWDRIFRELLLPDDNDPARKGASPFLRGRVRDLDKLTGEVSALFFGVNISCAQCHDHPLVTDWKQDHFYGLKAFFNRTFERGGVLGESEFGQVKFKTTKGLERRARLMFLTGKVIDDPGMREPTREEQRKEKERLAAAGKKKGTLPPPAFSARAKLVDVALQPGERDFFARSIVNRLWNRLFGYGLVMPLDQMHSQNPPSHTQLLAWLARDLVEHHYDLRRLVRGLVLSRAYARSSRWEAAGDAPRPHLFAVAQVRALTPMQLATSLRLAAADPLALPATLAPAELDKRVEQLENSARDFARRIEQPREDFQIGVNEALLFSNNEQVARDLLADGGDRLVGRLAKTQDSAERIDLAVRATLSRPPTPAERQALGEYLARRSDRTAQACRQMVWALLTSSEFRFNH